MESVLFLVAHPDDLACAMGGTALLLRDRYELHLLCATKGETGIPGRTPEETAAIRGKEQEAAAALLGAKLSFLGRINRQLFADSETCQEVARAIRDVAPAALFTLWPLDHHMDHSAVSEIARRAALVAGGPPEIVYSEAHLKTQTSCFTPQIYVDISEVFEEKLALIRCHQSQNRDDWLVGEFRRQGAFRGAQAGCDYAEAFVSVRHPKRRGESLLAKLSQSGLVA
jgi:LmbE family N-acetylglucosaminyl deacetylase